MKSSNQLRNETSVDFDVQDTETENKKIRIHGGGKSPARKTLKRPVARKRVRKTVSAVSRPRRTRVPEGALHKFFVRLIKEGTVFPQNVLNEIPMAQDEYHFRQESGRSSGGVASGPFGDRAVEFSQESAIDDGEGLQVILNDRQLIMEIRRAIERDSAISSAIHKILVTAKNGVVILQGTVSSEQEQMIIEDRAVAVAGYGRVVNQLQVIEDIVE